MVSSRLVWATAYAESSDGFHWERINTRAGNGTNRVLPYSEGRIRDGCSVWLDLNSIDERYKMFLFTRDPQNASMQNYEHPQTE